MSVKAVRYETQSINQYGSAETEFWYPDRSLGHPCNLDAVFIDAVSTFTCTTAGKFNRNNVLACRHHSKPPTGRSSESGARGMFQLTLSELPA